MSNINEVRRKVMTMGNKLRKSGSTLREALKLAWYYIKKQILNLSVKGTSFGKRQTALAHLMNYGRDSIRVYLVRESNNKFDNDAIAVVVRVIGKGSYKMGYVGKNVAKAISVLMDKGYGIAAGFENVTGGPLVDMPLHYGLKVSIKIA